MSGTIGRVSLRTLSLWLHSRLRRPAGLMAASFVLAVMVLAGVPSGEVHAHEGGDQQHDHHASAYADDHEFTHADAHSSHDDAPDADQKSEESAGSSSLHAHDACTAVPTLPSAICLGVKAVAPAPPEVMPTISPPSAKPLPNDRPPIA